MKKGFLISHLFRPVSRIRKSRLYFKSITLSESLLQTSFLRLHTAFHKAILLLYLLFCFIRWLCNDVLPNWRAIKSYPVLSSSILSYPVLSSLEQFCPIQLSLVQYCNVQSCSVLFSLYNPIQSCLITPSSV